MSQLLLQFFGVSFPFGMTTLGAAVVFFKKIGTLMLLEPMMLGFAAGVMTAASAFSLLLPAMEEAAANAQPVALVLCGGFFIGILLLWLLERGLENLNYVLSSTNYKRLWLLFLAITLHNIPEGMAVGLSFAKESNLTAALALSFGIGVQNLPEGAAIAMPLLAAGEKRTHAFLWGVGSGVVEPLAALWMLCFASSFALLLPWMLSAAAGTMMMVVCRELLPEAIRAEHRYFGIGSVLFGFFLMTILDLLLG